VRETKVKTQSASVKAQAIRKALCMDYFHVDVSVNIAHIN
jgi:hypothetical protein